MEHWFRVQHLDVDRLLAKWRWLCSGPLRLVARDAFGDLFLADELGHVWRLDISAGKLQKVAESEIHFHQLAEDPQNRQEWFGEVDERELAARGLAPNVAQCIGFYPPLICKEGPRRSYLIDVYEHVSFLGELNQQLASMRDGEKVRLHVGSCSTDY
jgi:hypothetical protein